MTADGVGGRGVELLDAAVLEFLDCGYSRTGVREITERAGVGHGTFYNYFENKRQMLSVLIDREFTVLLDAVSHANSLEVGAITERSLRRLMIAVSTRVLTRIVERLDVFTFLFTQVPGVDDRALDDFVRLYYASARRADRILQPARDAGVVDADLDHAYVSETWVSFLFAVAGGMIAGVAEPEPSRAAEVVTDLLLDGAVVRD